MNVATMSRRERQRLQTRTELVEAAHAIVKEEGYDGLTIRRLAERVGMATMSVYSYFADKQAILMAIAEDSFQELARRCEARRTNDPFASLKAGLDEYVAFGLDNPNEYRTVFMTEHVHEHDYDGEKFDKLEAENPAFQSMLRAVRDCIDVGVLQGDARAMATILWTVAHGAVSLIITFPLYQFGDRRAYAAGVVDLALDSMTRRTITSFPEA